MKRQSLHPFFVLDLVALCRKGRFSEAAESAFRELERAIAEQKAKNSSSDGVDSATDDVVMVPSLSRRRELGYDTTDLAPSPQPVQEQYDEQSPKW